MRNTLFLLEAMEDLPESYILAAHADLPRRNHRRLLMIAAAAAAALLLAGCAAFAYHWYVTYFSLRREEPLSGDQVAYIQENAQDFSDSQSQTHGGYTVALESAISDGNIAYLTLGITAPEDVDLTQYLPGEENPSLVWAELYATPVEEEGYAQSIETAYCEDGDGKDNTIYMVLTIEPNLEQQANLTFGPDMEWKIVLADIAEWGLDVNYLARGTWEFRVTLDFADLKRAELLTAPMVTKGIVCWKGEGAGIFSEAHYTIEDVTITSLRLCSLGVIVELEQPQPEDQSLGVMLNLAEQSSSLEVAVSEGEAFFVQLKDGTRVDFWQTGFAHATAYLRADSPLVLEEVDFVQLSDGQQIKVS